MTPKYLMVDGMISGTGIRDAVAGGYVNLAALRLSSPLLAELQEWLDRYHDAFYQGFTENGTISSLDIEGVALAERVASELPGTKVDYFSDAIATVLKPTV